jgi:hypothetical protein
MTFKFIHVGVSRGTVQVAVDWMTHIVYWSDSVFRWIVGAPADINLVDNDYYKIIVDKHLDAPDGLAVDPQAQLVYLDFHYFFHFLSLIGSLKSLVCVDLSLSLNLLFRKISHSLSYRYFSK